MSDKILKPVVMALGYFDSVHLGHKKVIETAREYARENNLKLVVFTFKGNLKAVLSKSDDKCVYLFNERKNLLKEMGADEIYFAPVSANFLSLSKEAFLKKLGSKYDVKCFVCGTDYRFGKFGEGDVSFLKQYCQENAKECIIESDFLFDGEKVSTTLIKKLLTAGEVEKANVLLGRDYSITGKVFKDRMVGSKIGFPTVNIKIDEDKFRIKDGVYEGKIKIYNEEYKALINYGARPTFDLSEKLVETHVIGFSGDLYGKEITISFLRRIRDVIKFSSKEHLISQIKKDILSIKEEEND